MQRAKQVMDTRMFQRQEYGTEEQGELFEAHLPALPVGSTQRIFECCPHAKLFNSLHHEFGELEGTLGIVVRGSLYHGTADKHSDVDFLVITEDDKFWEVVEESDQIVRELGGLSDTGWIDTIVPNFGGIGRVYLIDDGEVRQVDVYITPESRAERILEFQDKSVLRLKRDLNPQKGLQVENLQVCEEVRPYVDSVDSLSQRIKSVSVLTHMLTKDLMRSDLPLCTQYLFDLKKELGGLIRTALKPGSEDYGFYNFQDHLKEQNTNYLERYLALMQDNLKTSDAAIELYDLFIDVVRDYFPEYYRSEANVIHMVSKHLETNLPKVESSSVGRMQEAYGDDHVVLEKTISRIEKVDPEIIEDIRAEISSVEIPWQVAYSEYQSGSWKTASLMNHSRVGTDVVISDGRARGTDLLEKLPSIERLLNSLGLDYMWVRLAQLEPDAFLWEHKDHSELNRLEKIRIHIPITTDANAYFIAKGKKVFMSSGGIWKLDLRDSHAVAHFGKEARTHIIADCYMSTELEHMLESSTLDLAFVSPLPSLTEGALAKLFVSLQPYYELYAKSLDSTTPNDHGNIRPYEESLLLLFHTYNLLEVNTNSFQILQRFHESVEDSGRAEYWREKENHYIPES